MFKNKRSFFERITGSVSFDDKDFDDIKTPSEEVGQNKSADWLKDNVEEGELAVDVFQTPHEIVIRAMISGVKPEDLNISISREMVTIKGRREETERVAENDYFQKELYWGAFSRTILLPSEIETDEADATEKHGLLTLRLPKIDKQRIQKLKIKSL